MAQSGNRLTSEHAGELTRQTVYRQGAKPPKDRAINPTKVKKVGTSYGQPKFAGTTPKARRVNTPGHTKSDASHQTQSSYRSGKAGY